MTEFLDCSFDLNLVDLSLVGGPFTWSNNQTYSWLDRFLILPDCECHYPGVSQKRLPCLCSDHFPILLDGGGIQGGRRSFRFENMWLKSEGFVDKVRHWWSSYQFHDTPSFILAGKLKTLKNDLKLWNSQSFGDVGEQKQTMTEEIQNFDRITEDRVLTLEELSRKIDLVSELERILSLEEISWCQKSRALWVKEGDRSTKFFHSVTNSRRRNNTIEMLKINGRDCTEAPVIRDHMVSFLKKNFQNERDGGQQWMGLTLILLNHN
ncbi:hypothetical protein I3843_07G040700 [Carya illinoinensis]|nr:hypothetical protein I3843_07G040700 [Carya illinoinensis]